MREGTEKMAFEEEEKRFAALDSRRKTSFLAWFAHGLTIAARGAYENGDSSVSALRAFNELLHTVTGQLGKCADGNTRRYPDDAFWAIVREQAGRTGYERDVQDAARHAFQNCSRSLAASR